MNFIKIYAKAVAAFVAGVLGNMVVNLINGAEPWPQTTQEWVQFAVTSFAAAIGALAVTNKITQKQIDNDPNVVGGVVVPDKEKPAPRRLRRHRQSTLITRGSDMIDLENGLQFDELLQIAKALNVTKLLAPDLRADLQNGTNSMLSILAALESLPWLTALLPGNLGGQLGSAVKSLELMKGLLDA